MTLTTEPCFVAEVKLVDDAATKRAPHRAAHLERIEKLADEGALLLAGAYDDLTGSLLVFRLLSEHAVKAIVESDIYWKNGVWTDYTVRKLNRVVPEAPEGGVRGGVWPPVDEAQPHSQNSPLK